MIPVHIAGVGMTRFGKSSNTLVEIMRDAAVSALTASKIQDLDAIYVAVMNPEEYTGDGNIASHIAKALGLRGIPAVRVETASSTGAAAVHVAFQGVASGYYRHVLVVGGEKMTHLTTSASTRILAEVIDVQERNCGATMPALAAMVTASYRRKYRLSESALERVLCAVAMKNHANGAHNPCAQFRQVITQEKYFASKFVATPLRLYDCAPMTDGAAAIILTGERTDVAVSGIGQGTGPVSLCERETFTCFPATQIAANRAYRMASISPREIDCAEVHDAFTPLKSSARKISASFRQVKECKLPHPDGQQRMGTCRSTRPAGSNRAAIQWALAVWLRSSRSCICCEESRSRAKIEVLSDPMNEPLCKTDGHLLAFVTPNAAKTPVATFEPSSIKPLADLIEREVLRVFRSVA